MSIALELWKYEEHFNETYCWIEYVIEQIHFNIIVELYSINYLRSLQRDCLIIIRQIELLKPKYQNAHDIPQSLQDELGDKIYKTWSECDQLKEIINKIYNID